MRRTGALLASGDALLWGLLWVFSQALPDRRSTPT
jgi:hypothetical protein